MEISEFKVIQFERKVKKLPLLRLNAYNAITLPFYWNISHIPYMNSHRFLFEYNNIHMCYIFDYIKVFVQNHQEQ